MKVKMIMDERWPTFYIVTRNALHDTEIELTEEEYDLIVSAERNYALAQSILKHKFDKKLEEEKREKEESK